MLENFFLSLHGNTVRNLNEIIIVVGFKFHIIPCGMKFDRFLPSVGVWSIRTQASTQCIEK
jgi:hypothetical protein